MTVEKGVDWGEAGVLPPNGIVVRDDHEANRVITAAKRARKPVPPLGLLGGDLCRTLGGTGDAERLRTAAVRFPVDLGEVLIDGTIHWFLAHLVARRRAWRGRVVVAMNAQFLGPYDLAPRSHPNDGLLDITDGALPLGELLKARRRARTGTHLPHPSLHTARTAAAQFDLRPPLDVWLDGHRLGTASKLSVRVRPDAVDVYV